jgi:hypothetical protein
MAKNQSLDILESRLINMINELWRSVKALKQNQVGYQGYITFPTGTSDPASAPNGSMYYNSSTGFLRKKTAGTWSNV